MKSLTLMAAIVLAAPVFAQDAATVKKTIQAQYNKEAAALAKKDIEAALSINTSDFTTITIKNEKQNLTEARASLKEVITMIETIKTVTTIKKITIKENTATVITEDNSLFILNDPNTGKKVNMKSISSNEDIWIKQKDTWKRQSNKEVSDKTYIDGKLVKD